MPKNNSAYQNRLRFNRAKRLNKGAPAWNPHDLVQATKGLANVQRAGQTLAKVLQILQQASLRKISFKKSLLNTIVQELKSHYIEDKKIKKDLCNFIIRTKELKNHRLSLVQSSD